MKSTLVQPKGKVVSSRSFQVQGFDQEGVSLEAVMAFQFDPLVYRMIDKYGWSETEARQVFEDTKRFLYLCGAEEGIFAPMEKVDECWHNFILYCWEYEQFCHTYFGKFIYHSPVARNGPTKGDDVVFTMGRARELFGELSDNWYLRDERGEVITDPTKIKMCCSKGCGGRQVS